MAVNAACSGYRPPPDFDPGARQAPTALEGTPLTRLWRARPLRGPSAPVARDSLNLYLGGSDRRVIALDLESGKTRWTHRVAGPMLGGILEANGVVYAATDRPDGAVHAFEPVSGNERWTTGTGYVEAPLALAGDRIIVLNRRGQALALDAAKGDIAWRRRVPSQRLPALVLPNGRLLVTSYDSLYLLDAATGNILRRRRSPGTVTAPWVPLNDLLVAGTGDSTVIAVDPDSLTPRWSVRVDAPVLVSPAVSGDTVFAVTRLGSLFRITGAAGRVIVQLRDAGWAATGAPSRFGSWLLVGGADGTLHAFEAATGEPAWTTQLGRPLELAPILLDDGGFVALGGQGDLHRIRR